MPRNLDSIETSIVDSGLRIWRSILVAKQSDYKHSMSEIFCDILVCWDWMRAAARSGGTIDGLRWEWETYITQSGREYLDMMAYVFKKYEVWSIVTQCKRGTKNSSNLSEQGGIVDPPWMGRYLRHQRLNMNFRKRTPETIIRTTLIPKRYLHLS